MARKSLTELAQEHVTNKPAPAPMTPPGALDPPPEMREPEPPATVVQAGRNQGRALKPKRLNVDLDPDFYDAVAAKAEREGRPLSRLVRTLLEKYLRCE